MCRMRKRDAGVKKCVCHVCIDRFRTGEHTERDYNFLKTSTKVQADPQHILCATNEEVDDINSTMIQSEWVRRRKR